MSGQLLIEYLDRQKANYRLDRHPVAYTALETAQASHTQGQNFAKVVMIKVDGELAMMVLPAHYHVAPDVLQAVLSVDKVVLATENEFARRFPRCELGAMPPFGHLFGLDTYMVPVFDRQQEIAFNAGNHSELIRMPMTEYQRLAAVTEVPWGVFPPPKTAKSRSRRSQLSA
ncbi:aminoacyl-tRNA deacylase [Oceanicoccus sp. KOV_DT_Chl]|uniref:aminoacyl-tRNA deacylase n=1 Tax=Oceanicoccus sp. KOV_DT_Chl TaxID=1904639 RepID=UPI000C7AB7B7|nr:YbaK/EbsC family protein [Oceanicoccus sp. KOV_DT_Chl]